MTRTNRLVRILIALGMLLALGLLAGCAKTPAAQTETPASSEAPATEAPASDAPAPTIAIVSPAAGAEVPAGDVEVKVDVTNLKFTMPSNTNVPGEGHVHFTLDSNPFEMSVEPGIVLKNVAPGPHKLVAEVVQNDTKPLDPPVEQEIEFVAK